MELDQAGVCLMRIAGGLSLTSGWLLKSMLLLRQVATVGYSLR